MAPMKEVSKINVKCASGWLKDEISLIKELCEIKDVLYTTRCVHHILDYHHKNSGQCRVTSEKKHLSKEERVMLHDVLSKYEFLFNIK